MKKTSTFFLSAMFFLVYLLCTPCFGTANDVSIIGGKNASSNLSQKDRGMRLADLPVQARAKISQHLKSAEYEVSNCKKTLSSGKISAYRAFNRKQSITAYFINQGIDLNYNH